jgi:TatD DNase family protein
MYTKDNHEPYLIDTHAHLDMLRQMAPTVAVSESFHEGVKYIINVGSSIEGSRQSLKYAMEFENVFASAGIHPHHASEQQDISYIEILEEIISSSKKVIAIGETGFDYFRNLSPKDEQKKVFIEHIALALKYNLPLVIHDRDAHEDMYEVLKEYHNEENFRAVIHCFSGNVDFAVKCLELGCFISFTGVITFPNAKSLIDVVKEVPLERMFLETDAPFLAPQQVRGKENYPGYVKYIGEKIAEIKNTSFENVASVTSKSAMDFFNLK